MVIAARIFVKGVFY